MQFNILPRKCQENIIYSTSNRHTIHIYDILILSHKINSYQQEPHRKSKSHNLLSPNKKHFSTVTYSKRIIEQGQPDTFEQNQTVIKLDATSFNHYTYP